VLPEPATRFVAGLVLSALHLVAPAAYAADPLETDAISAGMSIREAVRQLESQGIQIVYSTDVVRARMRVQATPVSSEPQHILEEILRPNGLGVLPGPNDSLLIVRDARDRDAVVDSRGEAEPDRSQRDEAGGPRPIVEEIVVAASRYELGRAISNSRTTLGGSDIEYSPDMGEDALRAVSHLPGMAGNGVSSRQNVRGGEIGETLVRFDGLRLYDPFHLKDFQSIFSTLDPRVVDEMQVYTGGFPAAFGDRMSGVIDVVSMSPTEARYHEIGLSFFNSSLLSSGRFDESRGEWLVSARRSNLDLLYDAFSQQPERPQYQDAFVNLAYTINDHLAISGNFHFSQDDISLADDIDQEERAHAGIDDAYFWFGLDHTEGPRFSGRTLIARSDLSSTRSGTSMKSGISHGLLSEQKSFLIESLQSDWTETVNSRLVLQFGAIADRVRGRYDYHDEVEFDLLFDYPGTPSDTTRSRSINSFPTGHQYGAYASARFGITSRLDAEFGLRGDRQDIDSLSSSTLSPRIGIRYRVADRTVFRASLGRFSQSQTINELQVSDGVDEFFAPQRSDHLVIGLEHTFNSGLTIRSEAYGKSMDHLRPRFENLLNSLILLPELKPDRARIAPLRARARGIEVMLESVSDNPLNWRVAYTYSSVEDRLSGGTEFRSWDQTHALSAGLNWATPKWNVAVDFIHRTGWPISVAELAGERDGLPLVAVTGRNAQRLDFYQSLDIQFTRTIQLDKSEVSITFELINLLDRDNPCCTEYEIGDEDEAGQLLFKTLDYFPRIPSIGLLWKF